MKKITQPELLPAGKNCLVNEVGTTTNVYSVPLIINNDATRPYASFLFTEGSEPSMVNDQQTTNDKPQTTDNNKKETPAANDELGQKKPGSAEYGPHWLVNDDLAACGGVESDELRIKSYELRIMNDEWRVMSDGLRGRRQKRTFNTTTNSFQTKPNNNDATQRPFASFSFLIKEIFRPFIFFGHAIFNLNLKLS